MGFTLRKNSRLRRSLGEDASEFLFYTVDALTRVLPHVETSSWKVTERKSPSQATFVDANKRELRLAFGLTISQRNWAVDGRLSRRHVLTGVGAIKRTIDNRERALADGVLKAISQIFQLLPSQPTGYLSALRGTFDERVIAEYLGRYHRLQLDLAQWFAALRQLAEQTDENRALAFGCVIDTKDSSLPSQGCVFPRDFLLRKKYRVLSDGYRTAYRISAAGAIRGFVELTGSPRERHRYYPEWCEAIASRSRGSRVGICLTRQGDLLVMDGGKLGFTYRLGRWQYWNHPHLVDLIRNAARVQRVPPKLLSGVVRSIYRAALDVSFRRSGGLFVLLRNRNSLRSIVRSGDAVDDPKREAIDRAFDSALVPYRIQSNPRSLTADLAGLDGAVVLKNTGEVLAFGAILEPKRKGKIQAAEGSRTKAAIGASNYGLALKVSADGDMTVYVAGKELFRV